MINILMCVVFRFHLIKIVVYVEQKIRQIKTISHGHSRQNVNVLCGITELWRPQRANL